MALIPRWRRLAVPFLAAPSLPAPSLPAGVIAAAMMICVLIVGLDGWRTWQARCDIIADELSDTANLARSLAQHAHDTVQSADTALIALRDRIEASGATPEAMDVVSSQLLAHTRTLPILHGLFVYDATGALHAHALAADALAADALAADARAADRAADPAAWPLADDQPSFQDHRSHAHRDADLGPPQRGRVDGHWVVTVSRRINAPDGSFAGMVMGTISIEALNRFYATFNVGPRGAVILQTAAGIIVARQPNGAITAGVDASASPVFDVLHRAPAGSFEFVSPFDGVARLGSYHRVDGYPLVTAVADAREDVLASWRRDAMLHLGVSGGAAVALAVLGTLVARQLRRRQAAERHYRLLADNSSDAIMCTALDDRRLYISPAFTVMTGWTAEDALAAPWGDLVHPDDLAEINTIRMRLLAGSERATASFRYRCRDGSHLWVEGRARLVEATAGQEAQFIVNIRDISERKAAEDRLAALNRELALLAATDPLTGLANRRRFDEAIDQEWRRALREGGPVSLLLIDLDRFKRYNDRYGHPQGDACLRAVAHAIEALIRRPGDVAARYGGEELAVILGGTEAEGAAEVAARMHAAVRALALPHEGNDPAGIVTASFGAATMRPRMAGEARGPAELIAAADAALYEAKRAGRDRVVAAGDLPAVAPPHPREAERMAVLDRLAAAGGLERSDGLDGLAQLTASLFGAPVALVSLVGAQRQHFVGRFGLDADGTGREVSFCAHALHGEEVFVVPDAVKDPRFAANALVTGTPGIRFYAGAPLLGASGQPLGALCIIDRQPRRPLTAPEKALLATLAALASAALASRQIDALDAPRRRAGVETGHDAACGIPVSFMSARAPAGAR